MFMSHIPRHIGVHQHMSSCTNTCSCHIYHHISACTMSMSHISRHIRVHHASRLPTALSILSVCMPNGVGHPFFEHVFFNPFLCSTVFIFLSECLFSSFLSVYLSSNPWVDAPSRQKPPTDTAIGAAAGIHTAYTRHTHELSVLLQAYKQRHPHAHALVLAHDTLTHTYTRNAGLRRKRRTRAWMLRLLRRQPLHGQTHRYTTHPYTHTNSLTFSSFTYNTSYAHTHTHLPALPEGRTTGMPPLPVTMGVRVSREQSADWPHAIAPSLPEDAE